MKKWNRQYRLMPGKDDDLPVLNFQDDENDLPVFAPTPKKKVLGQVGAVVSPRLYEKLQDSPLPSKSRSNGQLPLQEKQKLTDYIYSLKTPEEKELAKNTPENNSQLAYNQGQKKLEEIISIQGSTDPLSTAQKNMEESPDTQDGLKNYMAVRFLEDKVDGVDAKDLLTNTHFGQEGDDNATTMMLVRKGMKYDEAVKDLRKINLVSAWDNQEVDLENAGKEFLDNEFTPQLQRAAIRYGAMKDPSFAKELQTMGIDLNDPDLANRISSFKRGQWVAQYINDPDVNTYLKKEDPRLIPAFQRVDERLLFDNKEYGINAVANKVSKARQNEGLNDPIINFYGDAAKDATNAVAEKFLTPQELEIYNKEIRDNQEQYIDAPSLIEGFGTAVKAFGKGMINTFTEPFTSVSQTQKDAWDKEAKNVSADPKGISGFLRDTGSTLGLVASIGATGGVLGSTSAAIGVGFFGDMLEAGKLKFPDSPVKAYTSALVNTGLYIAMGKTILPANKLKAAFESVQPKVFNIVESLANGTITREAARRDITTLTSKAIDFASGTLAKNVKITAELTAIGLVDKYLDKVMGMGDEEFKKFHPEGATIDNAGHIFMSNIVLAGIGKFGEMKKGNKLVEESIWKAVNNPKSTQRAIDNSSIDKSFGSVNEIKENFNHLLKVKGELDQLKIHPKDQKRFLFESIREKVAKDEAERTTDPTIDQKNKDIIKDSKEIKEKILAGEDAESIVTEREQKVIDEKEKVDTEVERLTKANEFDNKEFRSKRNELDGRVPDDRIKIERLEQAIKEKNEDFEKKVSKLKPKEEPAAEVLTETNIEHPFPDSQVKEIVYRASTGGKFSTAGKGIYFTSSKDYANSYTEDLEGNKIAGSNVKESFVDIKNPLRIETQGPFGAAIDKVYDQAVKDGYDSIIAKDPNSDLNEIVVFDKSQIQEKSQPTTSVITPEGIESKKADIEKRRQDELKEADLKAYDENTTGLKDEYKRGEVQFDHPEINAKYDAELAELEKPKSNEQKVTDSPVEKGKAETNNYEDFKKEHNISDGDIKTIPISEVQKYSGIDRNVEGQRGEPALKTVDNLVHSIDQFGLTTPIHIRTDGKNSIIVDGETRLAALNKMGVKEVPVYVEKVESFSDRDNNTLSKQSPKANEQTTDKFTPQLKSNGEPKVYYHTSDSDFNEFKGQDSEGYERKHSLSNRGIYFHEAPPQMAKYGKNKYEVHLDIKNPLIIDNRTYISDVVNPRTGKKIEIEHISADDIAYLKEQGYDAVSAKYPSFQTVVFDPSQVKVVKKNGEAIEKSKSNETTKEDIKSDEPVPTETKEPVIEEPTKGQPAAEAGTGEPPKGAGGEGEGEGDVGGITQAANAVRRTDRGLPEFQRDPQSFKQWNNEAEKLLKEGYDVEKLMARLEAGDDATPVENAIRKIYYATIDAEVAKNPTDKLLSLQKRAAIVGDAVNRRAGQNLVSLKGEGSPLNSISDFYVAKMEAAGVDKLTDQQKKETKEAFDNVQKADKNATAAMEAYREEISRLKAENELLKQKKESKPKKEKGDWAQQRKDAVQGARDALKKLRTGESGLSAVPLPGIRELIAIAPHVKKYVGSLLGEGAYNLKEVVSKAFNEFKDILEGITEKDIHNIIAGEFNEPRPTRNELAAKMRDISDEAYYINKLERILAGKEPKSERKKVKRNKAITDLKEKIDGFRKEEAEFEKFYGESYSPEAKIEKLQDELDRVQSRREKEKPAKGTTEEREMSDREKDIRQQIQEEQAKWDAETDAAKIAKREYRKLETERNRQIERVTTLKQKLNTIAGGNLPQRQKREVKPDTPEIEAIKEEIKTAEKFIRSAKATQGRIRKMEEELQRLKDREEKQPSTVSKREPSDKEKELKAQIIQERKDFEKEKREAGQVYTEPIDKDVSKLEAIKRSNEKREKEIKERIAKGDFVAKKPTPFLEDKEMQRKFPQKYKEALDAIIKREEAQHEFDIALLKDEMSKRSLGKKGIDLVGDVIGTTKALVTGIDASGIGIQNLVAMIAHPRSAAKALPASFGDFLSVKNQERWLASVHSSESFPLAKKAGLDITEPQSLKSSEKEEIFTHNLLDKGIKFKGKKYIISKYTTKPFERIFTGLGNRMRWNLWTRGVEKLYREGYTWESHPEEFKSLAKVLNTETGRGKLHPQIDKAFNLVSAGIWSPRLMASRMNILGLGDLGNLLAGGKKGYYGGLTPKMRAYALKDLAKFIVFGTAFMGLAGLTFADDVDLDPNSSTFGSFLVDGKRYNIWGGFTQYVRLIAKYIAGGEKTGGGFRESNVLKTTGKFLWSKTTPAVGTAIGWFNKDKNGVPRDYMNQPMTISGSAESLIVPLSIRGIIKGVEKEGAGSILWTGVPSFVGLSVSYESDFKKSGTNQQTKPQGRPQKPQKQGRPQQTRP